jgi:hypothetical protein
MNKNPKFKKAIRLKLEEFYSEPEVKTYVSEWHMKIFKEPIRQEREKGEALQKEKEEDKRALRGSRNPKANQEEEYELQGHLNGNYYEKWIDDIAESSTLTRQRKSFLRYTWDILCDIDNSKTMYDATSYNEELYEILTTKYGQNMLEQFPRFASEMENEIYSQYSEGRIVEWEDNWYDVFGTSIHYGMDIY